MRARLALFLLLLLMPNFASAQSGGLNYVGADLRSFIRDVAIETGRTIIIDPKINGKVYVTSPRAIAGDALYEILLSVLRVNGYGTVAMRSGAIKIVPLANAFRDRQADTKSRGDRVTSRVFTLDHIDVAFAAKSIKKHISREGSSEPLIGYRQIMVTDFADNLDAIAQVLDAMDKDPRRPIEIVLENSAPRDMADMVMRLARARQGKNTPPPITAVPVAGRNILVLFGAPDALRVYVELVKSLDASRKAQSDMRVHKLKYASVEAILPMLQNLAKSTARKEKSAPIISAYEQGNALVVNAPADRQKWVADIIAQLDVPQPQVLVEAIIVEVSDTASKELGLQYLLAGGEGSNAPFVLNRYANTAPDILTTAGAILTQGSDTASTDALSGVLRSAAIESLLGTSGLTLGVGGRRSNGSVFGVVLNALNRDVNSNILSTPSIMTLDNQKAKIIVGQEIPITTGEVLGSANNNPFRTIERKHVGIQLEVVPQINEGDEIRLEIRQEVSSISGPLNADSTELITSKREMTTGVRVADGDVIVLGGLIRQDESISQSKVPLLGDIPLLGWLFRSSGTQRSKSNLMVFLRPTIIRTAEEGRVVTSRRSRQFEGLNGGALPNRTLQDILNESPK